MSLMNRRQKLIIRDFCTVLALTLVALVAMISFKNYVNRSEAIKAMREIAAFTSNYKASHGSIPSESIVESVRLETLGSVRLNSFRYRGPWIQIDSDPNEILAYAKSKKGIFVPETLYITLDLCGNVTIIKEEEFLSKMNTQFTQAEKSLFPLKNNNQEP